MTQEPVYQQIIQVDLSKKCFIGKGDATFVSSCSVKLDFLPNGNILNVFPRIRKVKFYGATSSQLELSIVANYISVQYVHGNFEAGESDKIKEILKNVNIEFQGPKVQ